jgi:mono/diheme cytochrome c family protein
VRRPATLASLALLAASCRAGSEPGYEYVPEMIDPVPYESFSANPVLPGGRTNQPPPPGAIALGETPFAYGPGPDEAARAGRELVNPLAAASAPADVARGEQVFRAVCAACHGPTGQGDGPIVPRFPAPPSLTAAHAIALPDGQLFHVMMRGQGLMPSHAPQVAPADRWRVVLFVRALQKGGQP